MDKVYEKLKSVNTKIVEQATDIEDPKSETSDLQTVLGRSKAENEKLAKANKDLREAVKQREISHKSHEKELNELEQYTRRDSVRIYGVADSERFEASSRTAELVASMMNSKLELPVSTSDIDIVYRLGKFRADGNKPIICKFVSRETKASVLKARRKLKGSAVVVREDLTIKKLQLLESVSGRTEVRQAWSDEGRSFALLHNGGKRKVD